LSMEPWPQPPVLFVKTYARPAPEAYAQAPTMMVVPEMATDLPNQSPNAPPVPANPVT
jgi:hypothetical protein